MRRVLRPMLITLAVLVAAAFAFLLVDAHTMSPASPEYVALGSSYAAGAGLGSRQADSPLLCARSTGGYPPRLARHLGLSLVDMSCGGAKAPHLLSGGQFFQGPQIRAIAARTRLVTITVGGNDVSYVGDLSMFAMRHEGSWRGWLARRLWNGPAVHRNYAGLERTLIALIAAVRQRAPHVRIVLATYPAVLPPQGTCAALHIDPREAAIMRGVARELVATTRRAAARGHALLVDMDALGAAHDACSPEPWTRGWARLAEAPFHPTARGAQATADAIGAALHQQL